MVSVGLMILEGTRQANLESILFIIHVDLNAHPDIVLADISRFSSFPDEKEMLFDLGTVFKIESFDYNKQGQYWICHMKTSNEGCKIAKEYMDFKQTQLNKSLDIEIVFGDLLHDMGEWHKSHAYFERLSLRRINDLQVHYACRVYQTCNDFDNALALKNMGEICMMRGDYINALDLFNQARDMYKRMFTLDEDHRDIAKCWHLIGQTQVALENITEAFETALQMWTNKLPKYHPDIALCHCSMGAFYADKQKMIDKAIEHFQIALSIYETQLGADFKHLEMIRSKLIDLNIQSA